MTLQKLSGAPIGAGIQSTGKSGVKWAQIDSAFKTRIVTGMVVNMTHKYPSEFLDDVEHIFEERVNERRSTPQKINAIFSAEFINAKGETNIKYLNTPNFNVFQRSDLKETFNKNIKNRLMVDLTEFTTHGSGWTLSKIIGLQLNINKYNPMRASSYIALPSKIQHKLACVNVRNKDEACFFWAVTSALYPADRSKQPNRTSSYPHYEEVLKTEGMTVPVTINQIPKFEQMNNMSINLYALEHDDVYPAYLSEEKRDVHVNLMIISKEDKFHYVWIKNLSRLVGAQISKRGHSIYLCDRCLHYCPSQEKLLAHEEDCKNLNQCRVKMPYGKFTTMKFKNYSNKLQTPYIVYMDTESLLEHGEGYLQKHIPYSVGYFLHCTYDNSLSYYKSHRGPDCITWFCKEMEQLAEDVEPTYLCPIPMDRLTPQQHRDFYDSENCHICGEEFTEEDLKVRDHCHFTG